MVLKNYPNLSNQDSEFIFILRYYIFIEGQVFDDDFGLGGREGGRGVWLPDFHRNIGHCGTINFDAL